MLFDSGASSASRASRPASRGHARGQEALPRESPAVEQTRALTGNVLKVLEGVDLAARVTALQAALRACEGIVPRKALEAAQGLRTL